MIIIFIDSLPHLDFVGRFPSLKNIYGMRPSLGYSINVKSEMFGGGAPDQIGIFNEWNLIEKNPKKLYVYIASLADWVEVKVPFLRRLIRRVVMKVSGINIKEIPYRRLLKVKYFNKNPYSVGYPFKSIFPDFSFQMFTYERFGGDESALLMAEKYIRKEWIPEQNVFIGLAGLDHVHHLHGQHSDEYRSKRNADVNSINKLISQVMSRASQVDLVVCSDHGMADVLQVVAFDPSVISDNAVDSSQFEYFVDATMLRIWGVTDVDSVESALRCFPGKMLSQSERAQFGLTDLRFGDVIFVLEAGVMFAPSDVASSACRAMHGYFPHDKDQLGGVASNFEFRGYDCEVSAAELRSILVRRLSSGLQK